MNKQAEDLFEIPEWIRREETRNPPIGRDAFINKSIVSILSVISKIKAQDTVKPSKYKVNTSLRVIFTFALIILISISRNFSFVAFVTVYLLITLSMLEAKQIISILKISSIMTFFTFVVLLPAAAWGNSYSLVMITSKVFATITAVNIISHSAKWNEITNTFKKMFVPDLFILILDMTIKYIFLLGELALNMLYALKLRSLGINKSKYTSLAGIGGTIFMKSAEMAEEMYSAMKCRGYTGEYGEYNVVTNKYRLTAVDAIYIFTNITIAFVFIYLARS